MKHIHQTPGHIFALVAGSQAVVPHEVDGQNCDSGGGRVVNRSVAASILEAAQGLMNTVQRDGPVGARTVSSSSPSCTASEKTDQKLTFGMWQREKFSFESKKKCLLFPEKLTRAGRNKRPLTFQKETAAVQALDNNIRSLVNTLRVPMVRIACVRVVHQSCRKLRSAADNQRNIRDLFYCKCTQSYLFLDS